MNTALQHPSPHHRPLYHVLLSSLILFVIALIAVACASQATTSAPSSNGAPHVTRGTTSTRSFTVRSNPVLRLSNHVGSIHLQTNGAGNSIRVQAVLSGDDTSGLHVSYAQQGDTVTITGTSIKGIGVSVNTPHINFTVTIPDRTVVQVSSHVGEIVYQGMIASGVSDQLKNDTGTITVTLPKDATFRLDATAHAGDVQVDFPNVTVKQNLVGSKAQATIGSNPTASLTLTVAVGDIKIHQA
jgi:hypothetical protein